MKHQFKEQKEVGIFFYRFKNGESGADIHARMSLFLQHIFRRILSIEYEKWDNIIIIWHDLTITYFNFWFYP